MLKLGGYINILIAIGHIAGLFWADNTVIIATIPAALTKKGMEPPLARKSFSSNPNVLSKLMLPDNFFPIASVTSCRELAPGVEDALIEKLGENIIPIL